MHVSDQSYWCLQYLSLYIRLTGDTRFIPLLDLPSFSCMEVGPHLQNCHPQGLLCSGLVQR